MFEKLLYQLGCWIDKKHPLPRRVCVGCGKRRKIAMSYTLWGNIIYCCRRLECSSAFYVEKRHMEEVLAEAGYPASKERLVIQIGG